MAQTDKTHSVFGYYWKKVSTHPVYLVGILLSLPITNLVNNYIPPLILANVLGRLSQHNYQAHQIWASFGWQITLFIIAMFAGQALWRVVDYFTWHLEGEVEKQIAEEVLDHMLDESTAFHANRFTGTLVSQTNKLMGGYVRTADTTIYTTYPLATGILIAALILGFRSALFSVVLVILSILYLIVAFKASRQVRILSRQTAALESRQTGYLADAITNVVAVKSFARGKYERQRFAKATAATRQSLFRLTSAHIKQMNYLGSMGRAMGVAALFVAVVSVMVFNVNIPTVFLIFTYTAGIADQLFNFSNSGLRNYSRSVGDASDMVEMLSQTPAVIDADRPEKSRIQDGEIEFKNVKFDHESGGESRTKGLFYNFNLHIKPGEKVGLVGHSGGGKTTLTKLTLRFMDIDGGEILIDGQNIADITQDDLRRSIAYVPQEPLLFHRSLAENIGYGKLGASTDDILKVSKMSHAHEFIKDLPNGYDTLVGERGIKLSGGQRQRVAIARAMVKDAPVLILDEATSALDSDSERLIQDALWKLMEGKTTVAIAHRLSTIQRMDRIVVLEDGRIAEQGSHKKLLEKGGIYATLWAHQSGGFLED